MHQCSTSSTQHCCKQCPCWPFSSSSFSSHSLHFILQGAWDNILKDANDANETPDNFDARSLALSSGGPSRASGGGAAGTEGGGAGGDNGGGRTKKKNKSPLLRDDLSPAVKTRLANEPPVVEGLPDEIESKKDVFMRLVLPGEWVETSEPVAATRGFETFVAGPVDAPTPNRVRDIVFFESEPEVNVVVNSFQDEYGVFVPAETTAMPGSLLNFRTVTNLLHPVTWEVLELFESVDRRENKTGYKFDSEAVIVDALGGERQPFSRRPDTFYAPSEVLIMDRNGKLILRNETLSAIYSNTLDILAAKALIATPASNKVTTEVPNWLVAIR